MLIFKFSDEYFHLLLNDVFLEFDELPLIAYFFSPKHYVRSANESSSQEDEINEQWYTHSCLSCLSFLFESHCKRDEPTVMPSSNAALSSSAPVTISSSTNKELDVNCLETKFDSLTLEKLIGLAQTNEKLRPLAGKFFHDHFAAKVYGEKANIYSEMKGILINCFSEFVRSVHMGDGDLRIFLLNRFQSLNEIEFYRGKLSSVDCVKDVLPNLETLKFIHCELDSDVHEKFLQFCVKLKRLYVRDCNSGGKQRKFFIGTSNNWLNNKYSTLEHLEVNSRSKVDGVIHFLTINPNIHTFSTTIEFLIANKDAIAISNIKLDVLSILHAFTNIDEKIFKKFVRQLIELQKRSFFKKLNLFYALPAGKYNYPSHLLSNVHKLYIVTETRPITFSHLIELEELYLFNITQMEDFDAAFNKLTKLNFIYFEQATIENILPFITRLRHLKHIKIGSIGNGLHFDGRKKILDLSAINDERAKMTNGNELTIHVNENIYLATKSAFGQTIFNSIKMKRSDAHDGFQDFY